MNASAADQFNAVADAYATSAVHAHGEDLHWLVESLDLRPGWSVLDVGTGAGHASFAAARQVAAVTAIDVADKMLRVAARLAEEREHHNITFLRAASEALPFADNTFDAVFSRFSAHHWPDFERSICEVARVLKPRAPFVLIDTTGYNTAAMDTFVNSLELLRDPSHAKNMPASSMCRVFETYGMRIVTTRTWDLGLETNPWLARANTAEWRREACLNLLVEAPAAARSLLHIRADGLEFTLPCALIHAVNAD